MSTTPIKGDPNKEYTLTKFELVQLILFACAANHPSINISPRAIELAIAVWDDPQDSSPLKPLAVKDTYHNFKLAMKVNQLIRIVNELVAKDEQQ